MDYKHEQQHGHGHDHQDDPHKLGLLSGQDDQQGHEKKSVLKKVKAKAKKLKDTITKHGHGGQGDEHEQHQDHQHENVDDDDDMEVDEGEDDEDEELVQDPEVHGAPIYESTAMRNADIPSSRPINNSGEHGGGATQLQPVDQVKNKTESPAFLFAVLEDLKEDPDAPKDGAQTLPGTYESKVTDPSGQNYGEVCGSTSSVVQSLDKMIERDTTEPAAAAAQSTLPTSTGSHDQFSKELSRPSAKLVTESKEYPTEQIQGSGGGGGYTEKLSEVTSALAGSAISAKNVVAAKLGYGAQRHNNGEEQTKETGPNNNNNNNNTGMGSWAEKLKPGEEHKVLSEMISEVLNVSKKGSRSMEKKQPPAADNNTSVKERDEEERKPSAALAKVRESREVARQLGTQDEKSSDQASAERTVADTIKGAVSSWWTSGGEAGKLPATPSAGK